MPVIYKICRRAEWSEAVRTGRYIGSADDVRDGFIHFSTREQLAGTAAKHFRGAVGLVLVAVDADALGGALVWETSRGGALFPHLYAELDAAAALGVQDLPLGPDGVPALPGDLA